MNDQERDEQHRAMFDRADKILDDAIRDGNVFSEELCNWAINQAMAGE